MPAVRVVTDSSCDLGEDLTAELCIEVVPLTIRFGDQEFQDRIELGVEDFYERMASASELPETAAPAPGAFADAFRRQAEAGADCVVCVTISSDLSATMQSARTAARDLEGELDVRVVDSSSITAGLGTQVLEAARAAGDGADPDSVVNLVDDLARRTHVIGALDTLDNLKRGGRIGGAKALLGSLLSVKPIVDISTGVVEEAGRARTRGKALMILRDRLLERPTVEHLCVVDGMAPDVDTMIDLLSPRYGADSLRRARIGPVIGTHAGPRVVGLTWVDPA